MINLCVHQVIYGLSYDSSVGEKCNRACQQAGRIRRKVFLVHNMWRPFIPEYSWEPCSDGGTDFSASG